MRLAIFLIIILVCGCTEKEATTSQTVPQQTIGQEKMDDNVILETSLGDIEIQLDRERSPKTVENFYAYVDDGSYDGTSFHRVISNFMIQGGGFLPNGDKKKTRSPIKLESDNGLKNLKLTLAMARTNDPNSATNQFFINVKDNTNLDYNPQNPGYAVFGKVVGGSDIVEKIRYVKTGSKGPYQDWPQDDVLIKRAYRKG